MADTTMFETLPQNRCLLLIDGFSLCWNATEYAYKKWAEVKDDKEREATILCCFLERLKHLSKMFKTNKFVFAWEGAHNLRKEIYPPYKENRNRAVEILPSDNPFQKKMKERAIKNNERIAKSEKFWRRLQHEFIPKFGFVNNFEIEGYEGDDIIAKICKDNPNTPIAIISEDADMYQCITSNICQVSIRVRKIKKDGTPTVPSILDRKRFIAHFGIEPDKWATVKAIGGCGSDNVPGVSGIGRKSAIQYLMDGGLWRKNGSPSTKQINIGLAEKDGSLNLWRKLVTLPYDGTPEITLNVDNLNYEELLKTCNDYGITRVLTDDFWLDFFKG